LIHWNVIQQIQIFADKYPEIFLEEEDDFCVSKEVILEDLNFKRQETTNILETLILPQSRKEMEGSPEVLEVNENKEQEKYDS